MNTKIIDLDTVAIAPSVLAAWIEHSGKEVRKLVQQGVITKQTKIPDERGQLDPDGKLTIFVEISGNRIEMVVPNGQWQTPAAN